MMNVSRMCLLGLLLSVCILISQFTLKEEFQLILGCPALCLLKLQCHVEGEQQLVSLKQPCGSQTPTDFSQHQQRTVEYRQSG